MTNAEIIQAIREEIARLQPNAPNPGNMKSVDAKVAMQVHARLNKLLSFISYLEKSLPAKVADGKVLEEEINRTYHDGSVADTSDIDHVTYENIAEHFYDLGCRRTAERYDELEYNRQRAEEPPVALVAIKPIIPAALKPLIATFKEQGGSSEIPNDLEEAAWKYAGEHSFHPCDYDVTPYDCFIDGAEWQEEQDLKYISEIHRNGYNLCKEQMMKEAVEGIVENWSPEPHPEITIPLNPEEYSNGDKVRVIIVKEGKK